MNFKSVSPFALALPLALGFGCAGDDTSDDGGDTTGTPTSDTTETPTTTTEDPTTTTEDPTTTTEDPTTTTDPDTSTTETPGEDANVRVMHLGVNAPGVDIFVDGTGPVIPGLEFRQSSAYAPVPGGDYTFQVSVAGTPAEDAVLEPMLTVDDGATYTVAAIGDLNETDGAPELQVIALVDDPADIDPGNVRITVIHAAPAVGDVDIWEISGAEPVELLADVPFAASATLGDLPEGPLQIGLDVDNDMVPDVTFDVDTTGLGGNYANVYANNDAEGGVALIAQLPDGTVLEIPAN